MRYDKAHTPSYRFHTSSGQAIVTLTDALSGKTKDIYLGTHESPESRHRYDQCVAEWLARGRRLLAESDNFGVSVNEVMLAYLDHALAYYRDPSGQPTREVEAMKLAFRPLKKLFGETPAAEFGPLRLKAVREEMIRQDLARSLINKRVGYIKRLFKWAVAEELIPPSAFEALRCLSGLQWGRSAARETERVRPVPEAHVFAILPYLPPTVRAMVLLQWHTGMRSGELVQMRAQDIDVAGEVWLYRPPKHKTQHLGRERVIHLGPACQEVLKPFLTLNMAANLFSPVNAQTERNAIKRAARRSKVQPSQLDRSVPTPKRKLGSCYNSRSYYAALRFGMEAATKAGTLAEDEWWHPHQIRHSMALNVQRAHGLDAARAVLGHAKPDLTAHYSGLDERTARQVAAVMG